MTIYLGSRYENDQLASVLTPSGERSVALFHALPPDAVFSFDEHIVVEGDRLDLIAYQAYASSAMWWVIADANPELDVPEPLPPGYRLRVPRAR